MVRADLELEAVDGRRPAGRPSRPALLMSRSRWSCVARNSAANRRTSASDARSSSITSRSASGTVARMRAAAASPRSGSRTAMVTVAPWAASARVVSSPRPVDAPVTRTRLPVRSTPVEHLVGRGLVVERHARSLPGPASLASSAASPTEHDVVAALLVRGGLVLLCHRSPDREWYPDVRDLRTPAAWRSRTRPTPGSSPTLGPADARSGSCACPPRDGRSMGTRNPAPGRARSPRSPT